MRGTEGTKRVAECSAARFYFWTDQKFCTISTGHKPVIPPKPSDFNDLAAHPPHSLCGKRYAVIHSKTMKLSSKNLAALVFAFSVALCPAFAEHANQFQNQFGNPYGYGGGMGMMGGGMGMMGMGMMGGGMGMMNNGKGREKAEKILEIGKNISEEINKGNEKYSQTVEKLMQGFSQAVNSLKPPDENKETIKALTDQMAQEKEDRAKQEPLGQSLTNEIVNMTGKLSDTAVEYQKALGKLYMPRVSLAAKEAPQTLGDRIRAAIGVGISGQTIRGNVFELGLQAGGNRSSIPVLAGGASAPQVPLHTAGAPRASEKFSTPNRIPASESNR